MSRAIPLPQRSTFSRTFKHNSGNYQASLTAARKIAKFSTAMHDLKRKSEPPFRPASIHFAAWSSSQITAPGGASGWSILDLLTFAFLSGMSLLGNIKHKIPSKIARIYASFNAFRNRLNFRHSRNFHFTRARRRISLGRCHSRNSTTRGTTSSDNAEGDLESQGKVSGRLARVSDARFAVGRLAKAVKYARHFDGRAVEAAVWALLDLPDAEIPAALHALNRRFAGLPGFQPLGLGELPIYTIHDFQRPEAGL